MCGIIGYVGKREATPILLSGLEFLEYRGYDSAGIALSGPEGFQIQKTTNRIGELKKIAEREGLSGRCGIGHTRWATHGAATLQNAHPHQSADGRICLVHNGIIENYAQLSAELQNEGIRLKSETDTEIIPNLISKYYKEDLLTAVATAASRLEGAFALGIMATDAPETLVAVCKFSPLAIGLGKGENTISSDLSVLESEEVMVMEDGEIALLTPHKAELFDFSLNPRQKSVKPISNRQKAPEKGEFAHFMLKEIFEQPQVVGQAVSAYMKDGRAWSGLSGLDAESIASLDKINIIACGSAYHAGMVGRYILERLLDKPVQVWVASEFRYETRPKNLCALTIAISQSGETADTLAALIQAKKEGSKTLAIVNVPTSSIARTAHHTLCTMAGPEIAVATTKGYTTQLVALCLFGIWMADLLGKTEQKTLAKDLDKIEPLLTETLETKTWAERFAKKSSKSNSVFFIGRNIDFALSLEASLKLKEISYIHSEAYPAGELKHGTISLIEEGTLVFALCCYSPLKDKMISAIREVKARGAFVVALTEKGDTTLSSVADEVVYLPKSNQLLMPMLQIVPLQLYAYYVALNRGCDVDKPRNLAKSVTVE